MALVTFTSDLGIRDYYVAAIKGAIITYCEQVVPIVDVTHSIMPFDIKEAAFTVRNSYKYFPKGTIHVVHMSSTDAKRRMLVSIVDGHFFVTFDNGFLSLAFEKTPHETYEVNEELIVQSTPLMEAAIGKIVNLLVQEYKPSDFAHLTTEAVHLRLIQPLTSNGRILGSVIHIDSYGNAITNITPNMLAHYIGEKKFNIYVGVGQINEISEQYESVEEGELVALLSKSGFIEIAICKGRADKLLALKVGTPVQITVD